MRLRATLGQLLIVVLLTGCASGARAPIEQKSARVTTPAAVAPRAPEPAPARPQAAPGVHVVTRGDTVHAIAWRYRLDYRDLIRWNDLRNPDLIYVGQRLRLSPPLPEARRPAGAQPADGPQRELAVVRSNSRPPRPAPEAASGASGPLHWVWPAQGKTSAATSISGIKGLEIRGRRGQEVKAAAAGSVVYSGSGLRGYGELIILKHNEQFLSAYAHNEARLVQEGGHVDAGETIARMGNTDAKDVMLHFEIRRNGKAVDPLQFLPRR